MLTVGFITIGCRSNQADTSRMISSLGDGFRVIDTFSDGGTCDLIIVNTCAVTLKAEADARKLIRRAKRLHPDSKIIVTGCASQVDRQKWLGIPEVERVIGIADRDEIRKFLETDQRTGPDEFALPSGGIYGPTPVSGHRSRPMLKIQDGCSRGCAYCIVPKARGRERSRPLDMVLNDLKTLSEAGYREIVLTGIHLGRWGKDIDLDLLSLLNEIDNLEIESRIRFSSLEPMDLSPEFILRMLSVEKVCPHLHIPLQSGDQSILDAMGRDHTLEHFEKLLLTARDANPDVSVGTDLIVGFPGETVKSHKNTVDFIKKLPVSYLHIFSFSPRPGTRAASMKGRPHGTIVKDRMDELKSLDTAKREAFIGSQLGKSRPFLIETTPTPDSPVTCISDNYIRIISKDSVLQNHIGTVRTLIIDNNSEVIR